MQGTSTDDRTEERTDDRKDDLSPPNKKQKVTKDAIHVDRPDLPEANLKGGVNENKRKMSNDAVVVYHQGQAASTLRAHAVVVHMPREAASRLRLLAQPASNLHGDAVVVHPPRLPASKLKWRGGGGVQEKSRIKKVEEGDCSSSTP